MNPRFRRLLFAIPFVFVLCIGTLFLRSRTTSSWQSAPNDDYAVGIDLTESYGTAAIRDRSGSVQNVVRVDGDRNYRSTMQRLSLESSRHSSPPYEWWHDGGALKGMDDWPRQLLRTLRKTFGLPASAEVGVIADLLSSIRTAAEQKSQRKITHAMISASNLVALYDEEIADAALHIRLNLLSDAYFERQPRHLYAGFSAYGLTNNTAPSRPGNGSATKRNVLSIHLTGQALEIDATIKETNRTCPLDWAQRHSYIDYSLGLDISPPNPAPSLPYPAWQHRVKALVQECVLWEILPWNHYGEQGNVTDILFLGESALAKELRGTVWDAVMEVQVNEPVVHVAHAEDLEYMASRGAAKMAWEVLHKPAPVRNSSFAMECWSENIRKYDNGIRYLLSQKGDGLLRPASLQVEDVEGAEKVFIEL